jgi:hypothetical protein
MKLIYPNNNNVILTNLNKSVLRALKSKKKILVSEVDNDNDVSNGSIADCYFMEKKS